MNERTLMISIFKRMAKALDKQPDAVIGAALDCFLDAAPCLFDGTFQGWNSSSDSVLDIPWRYTGPVEEVLNTFTQVQNDPTTLIEFAAQLMEISSAVESCDRPKKEDFETVLRLACGTLHIGSLTLSESYQLGKVENWVKVTF